MHPAISLPLQMPALEKLVSTSLADSMLSTLKLDFRSLVLRHHAETGSLTHCVEVLLEFIRDALVKITPVTDVNSENKLHVFWLSASLPPTNPTRIAFRCAPLAGRDRSRPGQCLHAWNSRASVRLAPLRSGHVVLYSRKTPCS